jgi:hypothetical protein
MGARASHPSRPSRPSRPASPRRSAPTVPDDVGCNLAVLWGACSTGVEVRTLASGRRLATLSVRTPTRRPGRGAGEPATSVPVAVWDPPGWIDGLGAGDPVVVVGVVRRRFFATASGTRGAKSEVEAHLVARGTPAQVDRAWRMAAGVLEGLR